MEYFERENIRRQDNHTKLFMDILGPVLILFAFGLIVLACYEYYFIILPQISSISWFLSLVLAFWFLFIVFNLVFNYILCIVISPGHTYYIPDVPSCAKCGVSKPMRAHHCQICDKCVLKMDHHCPWINSCVGFRNHRYFVLFLTYCWAGSLTFFFSSVGYYSELKYSQIFSLSFVVFTCFSIIFTVFAAWHWVMVVKGLTSIEILDDKVKLVEFNWRLNLEIVFGTRNVWLSLLPRISNLPYDGVYWPENYISA